MHSATVVPHLCCEAACERPDPLEMPMTSTPNAVPRACLAAALALLLSAGAATATNVAILDDHPITPEGYTLRAACQRTDRTARHAWTVVRNGVKWRMKCACNAA